MCPQAGKKGMTSARLSELYQKVLREALATPYTPSPHLLKMQVQGSNISRQEDAFEFKLLQQFGLIPRAPPGQGLTRSPVEGGVNYS